MYNCLALISSLPIVLMSKLIEIANMCSDGVYSIAANVFENVTIFPTEIAPGAKVSSVLAEGLYGNGFDADRRNVAQDWYRVGQDIHTSIGQIKTRLDVQSSEEKPTAPVL